jgi:hypothetical protein
MKTLADRVYLVRGLQVFNISLMEYYTIIRGDRRDHHTLKEIVEMTKGPTMWPSPYMMFMFHRGMRN